MHRVKHTIILMLENRSFFTNFGDFQKATGSIHDAKVGDQWINKDLEGKVYRPRIIRDADFRFSQYLDNNCVKSAEAIAHHNSGFVRVLDRDIKEAKQNNQEKSHHKHQSARSKRDIGSVDVNQPLFCFRDGTMPCTHALAKEYVLADQYYSSILGPTWSNRIMAMSGVCNNIYETPMSFEQIPFDELAKQNQTTLFTLLAEHGVDFKIYYGDFPLTLLLERNWEPEVLNRHAPMSEFYLACKTGTLPAVSWIEPRYSHQGNSFHPPSSPLNGERLIGRIYNALKSSRHWNECFFVITHDESGNLGDPITPPMAPEYHHHYQDEESNQSKHLNHAHHVNGECIRHEAHDSKPSCFDLGCIGTLATCLSDFQTNNPDTCFNVPPPKHWTHTLGIRVPTLFISPLVKRGVVDHTIYDHTSILKSLCERYQMDAKRLGVRTPLMKTFWHLVEWPQTLEFLGFKTNKSSSSLRLRVPKHDKTHYSGTPYNWTRFEIDILSGITYTAYTLQVLKNVILLPQKAIEKSWNFTTDYLHSIVKRHRQRKR